ncbi:hypothetical protein [Nonomuraea typhae]|uniref:hypothetical protein n=1 Tax=Nonomuraea typhae TaxID=2603600 RepID=UPI0012F9476B|nr:hypothetical protein [Nonomuraea typhae]
MSWQSYRARWRGADYEAVPELDGGQVLVRLRSQGPAEGFSEVRPGLFVRVVPAAECAVVWHVTTFCEWRGAPFLVIDARDGELLLEYTGGDAGQAGRLGLERVERGVHRIWVSRDEVGALVETAVTVSGG